MAKVKFSEDELKVIGVYNQIGTYYNTPYAAVERWNKPIPAKENMIRYIKGEDYEWVPDLTCDLVDITPVCIPDVVATGFEGGIDSFGVKWIPVESNKSLPSFVDPGFCLLVDIANWESLEWPDVDSWNWKEVAAQYREAYKDDDRMMRGVVMSGFFERLISIMTFEEAAMSLLTDPASVKAFFEKLAEMNNKIIDHYIDDFDCGAILIHDDWAAQRSPFFSLDAATELIVPYLKKCVDHVHERGAIFTFHSCGMGLALVPAMKAAGVDIWQAQESCLDIQEAIDTCGDEIILEIYPVLESGMRGKELEEEIEGFLKKYCSNQKCFVEFYDFDGDRHYETRKIVYRISRKMALQESNM